MASLLSGRQQRVVDRCHEYCRRVECSLDECLARSKAPKARVGSQKERPPRTKKKTIKPGKEKKTKCPWPAPLNVLRVHLGLPIQMDLLAHQIHEVEQRFPGSDFSALRLVRLAGMIQRISPEDRSADHAELLSSIATAFRGYRFWPLEKGKDEMVFWSENHLILYQSCDLLLQEWGLRVQPDEGRSCRGRVLAYLRQKKVDGFFEFNSHGYILFTLSALLNLNDFSHDQKVKALAQDGISQIIASILAFAMPSGAFYSVTGRGYLVHRVDGEGHDVNALIMLLTGADAFGGGGVTQAAAFFATSDYARRVPLAVLSQWGHPAPTWKIGRPLREVMNSLMNDPDLDRKKMDFVPFLW